MKTPSTPGTCACKTTLALADRADILPHPLRRRDNAANPIGKACRVFGVLTAALLFSADSSLGADCLTWIKRTDVGSYGQRWQHAMAYDSDRGVIVFFGGEIGPDGEQVYFDDTQEYDGKQWKQINTAVKPTARSGHSMVYDPVRKKVVLFGGYYHDTSQPFGVNVVFDDTWVYSSDGVNGFWELQQNATNIPPSSSHGMIWDASNRVVLVHRGTDTWSWNGTNWTKLFSGPDVLEFGMAFDTDRSMAMIVGGFVQGSLTHQVWEKPPMTGWLNLGPGPSVRAQLAMTYDERRKRVVMVGGVGESVETGETGYEYIPGSGWVSIPSLPSGQGRAGARMVYDSKRGVMVLTGGAGGGAPNAEDGGRYSDTWELWPSLFIGGQPLDTTNEVCTTATFSAGVQGNPPLHFTWLRDGAPLLLDARYVGSATAELQILEVRHSDAGRYELVVRDSCNPPNVVTSRVATLTTTPDSEWAFRTTNGPAPRYGHGMVYDSARRVTVLFGGRTNVSFVYTLNDLWEWDGARWTQRVPNSISNGWMLVQGIGWRPAYKDAPVRRAHFSMAFDSRRGRTVIFGGHATTPNNDTLFLRDLWEWDGVNWYFRGTNGPVPRYYGSMAYDERRGVTVLFGGISIADPGQQADTQYVWEWDGNQWHTNLPPKRPTPTPGNQPRMTYDSYRGVIVFGPTSESYSSWAFWDWDGTNWIDPAPIVYFTDPVVSAMNGSTLGGFAFDANRRRNIWFGGIQIAAHNRTAVYDGRNWALLTNGTPPPPRMDAAMAYDSDRRVMVMFGGNHNNSNTGFTNDTWELAAVDAPVINEQPASQARFPGETATFKVSALGHGFVAYQWYFNNQLIVGEQSDTLTIPNVGEEHVGEYYVRVGSECGSVTSQAAYLSLDQKLHAFFSGNRGMLFWNPALSGILEASDGLPGPWTVVSNAPNPMPIGGGNNKFFRYRTQ